MAGSVPDAPGPLVARSATVPTARPASFERHRRVPPPFVLSFRVRGGRLRQRLTYAARRLRGGGITIPEQQSMIIARTAAAEWKP